MSIVMPEAPEPAPARPRSLWPRHGETAFLRKLAIVAGLLDVRRKCSGAISPDPRLFAGMLASLFGFVYIVLGLETYSLLAGALALFAAISALMALTQKLPDWVLAP